MDMQQYQSASLDKFKKIASGHIERQYKTMEEFSFVNDISKSLISNFFSGKQKDFKYSTVERIAKALGIEIIFMSKS